MKKVLALILTGIMALAFFTGCSDPLYDDFENFLNVQMVDVNANYEELKAELTSWENVEDIEALKTSVSDKLLPLINDSMEKLDAIEPATEEVKAVKEKYVKVMDAYKEGFEMIEEALHTNDEAKMAEGNEVLTEGVALLDEYNAALEKLAEEVGCEIEY